MQKQSPITVILADDHELLRDGFKTAVATMPGVKLLAMAANGAELLQMVRQQQPDVVVCDIKMPVMTGQEATRIIKKEFPWVNVLGLTAHDEVALIQSMMEAGANGVVIKNVSKEELLLGLQSVKEGKTFYCSCITQCLQSFQNPVAPLPPDVCLTNREMEVLKLLCKGFSNKMIAAELGINGRTVETHRASLYKKTKTQSTGQLAIFAARHGLV